MAESKHPLSPHLQVYRLPLTALVSITHRITGFVNSVGAVILVALLAAAAYSPETYRAMTPHFAAWYGQILLAGFVFGLYLHFCNGLRHLFWDVGYGFDLKVVDTTARLAIVVALLLTGATWLVAGALPL